MDFPILFLKPQADRRIKLGHLWIYSNEVDTDKSPLKNFEAGEQVIVANHAGKPLGLALLNPTGLICARVLNRDVTHPVNKSLFVHRFKQALALREMVFDEPYYRLIHADSDLLPGLNVDRFGDYLVVQITSAGMESLTDEIVEALVQVLKPQGVLLANNHANRSFESLPMITKVAYGEVPEILIVRENGAEFAVPVEALSNDIWLYDQRNNRAELKKYVRGKRVLDVFSGSGAWGVQAALAGAADVICVDESAIATDLALDNAQRNGVESSLAAIKGKAVDVLKQLVNDGERFDIVIIDPPALIKRRKDQKAGEAYYRHLNELAIRLLGRDGILISASRSLHLDRAALMDIVRGASRHLDRQVQVTTQSGMPADHPVHPAIPETDYLKTLFARVYLA